MSTNDQYFQAGDKVMLVVEIPAPPGWVDIPNTDVVRYGEVYCVSAFWTHGGYNWIDLVGSPPAFDDNGGRCGYRAMEYRKVEEIKLCVAATERMKAPVNARLIAAAPEMFAIMVRELELAESGGNPHLGYYREFKEIIARVREGQNAEASDRL